MNKIDGHNIVCPVCHKEFHSDRAFTPFKKHIISEHDKDFVRFLRDIYYPSINVNTGYCKVCGKPTNFVRFPLGFRDYCSLSCSVKDMNDNKIDKSTWLEKRKNTCISRYGADNPMKSIGISSKMRETSTKRYGNGCPANGKEIRSKIEQESLKKNGTINPWTSDEAKRKVKETCLEKYGVTCVLHSKEVRDKTVYAYYERNYSIFKRYLSEIKGIELISSKEEYCNPDLHLLLKCSNCGKEFTTNNRSAERLQCPCMDSHHDSFGEINIRKFIRSFGINDLIYHDRSTIKFNDSDRNHKELDIYIPSKNLAIEFDSLYYHSSNYLESNYHLLKTERCIEKGIRLIHITDDEWYDKRDIVKSIIKSALGIISNKIYARKCIIKEVSNSDYKEFCIFNHIQGYSPASVRLGLYYNDQLVQLCSFGKSRFKSGEIELIRHCTLIDNTVVGGFSKLVKYYINKYHPDNLITYCDRRLFTGNGYIKTGWKFLYNTSPNYWYIVNNHLESRIKYQKHKLPNLLEKYDDSLTETENMLLNGYSIYYDCGSIKLKYPNTKL